MQTPFYNLSSTRSYNNISSSSTASTSSLQSLLPPPPINSTINRPNRPRRKRSHGNVNNSSHSLEAIDELPLSEDAHERGWIDGLHIRMGSGGSSHNGNGSSSTRDEDSINGRETKRIRPSLDSFEPAFASLNLSSPSTSTSNHYYNSYGSQIHNNFDNKNRDFNHHQNNNNNNNNLNSTRYSSYNNNQPPSLIPYNTISPPTPTPIIPTILPSSSSTSSLPVTPPMQQGENHSTSLSTSTSTDSLCPPPIFSPGSSNGSGGSRFSPTTPFGSPIDIIERSSGGIGVGIGDIKMGGTNTFDLGPNKIWVNSLDDSDDEEEIATSNKKKVEKDKELKAILAASGVGTLDLPDLLPKSILVEVSKNLIPSEELGLVLYKPLNFGGGSGGGILGDKEEKDLAFETYQREAEKSEREEEVIEINVGGNNGDGMMEEFDAEEVEEDMMDLDF